MKYELTNRPRRLRTSAVLRSMVRETRISADSLVYPFFVVEGENVKEEIKTMPGQYRWSIDRLPELFDKLKEAGFTADLFVFEAGETQKTRETKEFVEDSMLEKGYRRDVVFFSQSPGNTACFRFL